PLLRNFEVRNDFGRTNLMRLQHSHRTRQRSAAFSFVEALVATAVCGIMFLTVYAGLSSGFAILQLSRENLRGTQILQEKMESIRLYNWDQLTNASFIPTNFVDTFYPGTQSTSGITYTGKVTIAVAP